MFSIQFIRRLVLAASALLVAGGATAGAAAYVLNDVPSVRGNLPTAWQRGMNLTAFLPDAYTGPEAERAMLTARSTGTDRVALAPTWYMSDPSSNAVFSDPVKTPTDASLEAASQRARSLGLDVVLKPHVDVQDGTFRGEINPSDPSAWFASYDQMLLHYAEVAQRIDADVLVIGTELTTMTPYEADWRSLIDQIRSVYDGKLTFAANWVDGAEGVNFWDALDFIGIDAYMPLQTTSADPSVAQLVDAWGPYRARMDTLQRKWHRPIVFTELGYQSRQGTAARQGQDTAPVSTSAQQTAYEAAFTALHDQPWFKGIWWWDWSAEGISEPGGWSAEGKPAEDTLYDWQGAPEQRREVREAGAERRGA